MKSLFLLLPLTALASPERDALLGTYSGVNCYLKISQPRSGVTDIEFTDSAGVRFFWNVGKELEAQLKKGASTLSFHHDRQSLGDMTLDLTIERNHGIPSKISGHTHGWGGENTVDCELNASLE